MRAQRKEQLEEAPTQFAVLSLTDNFSGQRLDALVSTLQSCHATSTKKVQECELLSPLTSRGFESNLQRKRRSSLDIFIPSLDVHKVRDMLVFVFNGVSEMDQLAKYTIDASQSRGLLSIHTVAIDEDSDLFLFSLTKI